MPNKKLALNSGIQTKVLTNNDEVCILHRPSILLAVLKTFFSNLKDW